MERGSLSTFAMVVPHIWGRRISLGVVIAPNHRKRINRDLRILELVDNFGKSIALIWSGSCHPLGWPNELELSSDYIGVVRERLQDSIGRHTPVLFLQGFAGDLRPDVPENRKLTRRFWRTIFFGPSFASFDEMNWQTWVENRVALIATGLDGIRRGEAAPLTGHLASARVRIPLSLVLDGPDGGQRYVHFQRLRLGKMCEILSISAEPCSRLLSFLDDPTIWPIGYNGDVFGYWPTDQQRREGGYEANDYLAHFGLRGRLRPGLDRLFRAALDRLSEEFGRESSVDCKGAVANCVEIRFASSPMQ